jgi:hypothetical protein
MTKIHFYYLSYITQEYFKKKWMKHLRFQDGLDRISCLRLNSAVIVHIVNNDHYVK